MTAPEPADDAAADTVLIGVFFADNLRRAPPRGHGWAHRRRTLAARRQQAPRRRRR